MFSNNGQQSQQQQQQQRQQQQHNGGYRLRSKSRSAKSNSKHGSNHPFQNQAELQRVMSLFQ